MHRWIGGSVAPQVVGPQMDTDLFAGFPDHLTGGCVLDLKNPVMGGETPISDIAFQPVRYLLRNEDHLRAFSTFRFDKTQFPVVGVLHFQFQHFTDAHAAPGHEFQHDSVPDIVGAKNDLIDHVFFQDSPVPAFGGAKRFPEQRRVAGISQIALDVVSDEIEKGFQEGVLVALGGSFQAFSDRGQKGQDVIW